MGHKPDTQSLREVVVIRDLQRLAAEAEAARAAAAHRAKQALRDESERRQRAAEESWRTTLSGPSLQLDLAALWSSELRGREVELHRSSLAVRGASDELERRAADWHVAVSRRDVAQDISRKAIRDQTRKRDETALQDALDRHILRWRER